MDEAIRHLDRPLAQRRLTSREQVLGVPFAKERVSAVAVPQVSWLKESVAFYRWSRGARLPLGRTRRPARDSKKRCQKGTRYQVSAIKQRVFQSRGRRAGLVKGLDTGPGGEFPICHLNWQIGQARASKQRHTSAAGRRQSKRAMLAPDSCTWRDTAHCSNVR